MKPFRFSRIGILLLAAFAFTALGASARPQVGAITSKSEAGTIRKAIGSPSAPITMEIFGDFECPACRAFFEDSVKQVIDNYVSLGKVYLVYRDFPLQMHPYAMKAARIADAAAALGEFDTAERALYDHQDEWSEKGNIDEVIASSFPAGEFKKIQAYEARHMNEINASIARERAMGEQRNVNQTPTVFVTAHGKTEGLPGGGVDYKLLKQYFDYLLRQ
ncbi:MAG TPA: thioredoxin domain-containing protein [Candidatus Dormibacteraeota bacterium]|nr:thioredoxin domain-containing protein [Candidatus Dormibacteraeota bacterium]